MSTIKSSAENLTLNADGANNDIILQSNGSTKVTLDGQNTRLGIGTATPAYTLSVSGGSVNIEDGYAYGFGDNSYRIEGKDDGATTARIGFVTGGSEIARFTADGLTFNGDTAAANALDDYEEGTYAVVVSGSTSGTYNMDSNNTLAYTKIGRLVTIQGYVGVSSGSVSGNVRMNLPFTPTAFVDDAEYNFSSLMIQNTGNTNTGQKYLFITGSAYGYFYKVEDNGTASYMGSNLMDSAFQIAVSFTYISG